jgi:hypothetical protein
MKPAALTGLLLALAASAPAATVFTLNPPAEAVYAGESFIVDVTATTDLMYAFQGDFSFTAGLLQADNLTGSGDFALSYGSDPIDNANGQVTNFYASWVGPGGTTGTDVLVAQIFFTALAPGSATVSFAPAYVVTDPDTFAFDSTVSSNPENIGIAQAPEPAPLFTILFGALCFITRKPKL